MSISTAVAPTKVSAGTGSPAVWWKSGKVLFKLDGEQTHGRLAQVEVIDPQGSAPPLHVHHTEDETFFVLEGEITVFVGDERIDLSPGDHAFVPRGVPHAYLVRSPVARQLVTFSPSGFEQAFLALGVPAEDTPQPDESVFPPPEVMVPALAAYGCEVVGPPPSLADVV